MDIIKRNAKSIFKLRVFILIAVILLLLLFEFALGGDTSARRRAARPLAQNNPLQSSLGNFQSSLEMKENVDFLLTPAILVQEAISDDVVITYPSE